MNFKNKTAIVTGAGQGIGFEICRQLSKYGATVLLNDVNKELSDSAAKKINEEYGNCIPFRVIAAACILLTTLSGNRSCIQVTWMW